MHISWGSAIFKFEFANIFTVDFLIVMFTFLFVDMFDTVGTLIGCATKADMVRKDGTIPNCKEALFADAIGTTVGACLGTSTVTTFVESSAGVVEGGRTGLTALTVAVLFVLSLFLAPLFGSIPSAATAPALIMVGFFMMSPASKINWEDPVDGISAFLTIAFMTLSYSISNGIMFGILAWVIGKIVTKKTKDITVPTIVIAIIFLIYLILK